ncbi:MAG: hypothetical protein LBC64_00280 [Fibromonadaceae bacterium]|nr:hypothetical protein [Fibromonadaceae bacterium]
MKWFALLAAFLLAISCSDSDKASNESNRHIWIDAIDYETYLNKVYLIGFIETGIKNCAFYMNFGDCTVNNCWVINSRHAYFSLKNLDVCYIKDYLWIVDKDTIHSSDEFNKVTFGEHFVKLVFVDVFGDSISESARLRIDEPLKVTMLSPVDGYEAQRSETLVFEYRISGIDTWETWEDTVYVSSDAKVLEDETLLWIEGKALENKTLKPPLNKQAYYWGVKLSNQDTAFYSEIRSVWVRNMVN